LQKTLADAAVQKQTHM